MVNKDEFLIGAGSRNHAAGSKQLRQLDENSKFNGRLNNVVQVRLGGVPASQPIPGEGRVAGFKCSIHVAVLAGHKLKVPVATKL